jgi:DNA polymerase V
VQRFTEQPSTLALVLYTSRVPAGFPSPADDHLDGKLDLNEHLVRRPAATFFVRAKGESMKDAGIFDGDLLVVDRSLHPQADDIVIAVIHGELTVKRVKKPNDAWTLTAENQDYPDILLDDAGCEVWGIVTHSIRSHCSR